MKHNYKVRAKVTPVRDTERFDAVCPICELHNMAVRVGIGLQASNHMTCEHFDGIHVVVGGEESGDFFKFVTRMNYSPSTYILDLIEMLRVAAICVVEQHQPESEIEYFDVYQLLMVIAEHHPEPNIVKYLQNEIVGMESHRGDDS